MFIFETAISNIKLSVLLVAAIQYLFETIRSISIDETSLLNILSPVKSSNKFIHIYTYRL
jgi:hypothetical protein